MARKSPQQFIKRQKEMERAQKARAKMEKRHHDKKDDEAAENNAAVTADEPIATES